MATTVRKRTGDQLRDELLAAATGLLSERLSVNPPSLRETARACDVSATAVYRYFPSQQALLAAIAEKSLASLVAAIDARELDDGIRGGDLRVRTMARSYVTWAVANPGAYQLLFEGRDLLEHPEAIDAGIDHLQHRLESLLGDVSGSDRDHRHRAELLWIALHGLVLSRIRKMGQHWAQTIEEDAASLVGVFTR